MKVISLKVENQMIKNIDKSLEKHNYGTRTEFIRSAIRRELEHVNKEALIKQFIASKGSKNKYTNEEFESLREKIASELK